MADVRVLLAAEDAPSEAIGRRLLASVDVREVQPLATRGYGYLQKRCRELNRAATFQPVLLVTDQDSPNNCPASMPSRWLGDAQRHPDFIFRVAVMEIEAWILADHEGVAELLRVASNSVPSDVDGIPDPKQFLVNLARKSRAKQVRQALAPGKRATAVVGPEYNPTIVRFIADQWDIEAARKRSRSLGRALASLKRRFP